ncbi:MAG: 50S ribosomal protein L11 methyltransferase [Deltaproteobacteria bacterium]|nr:50S ribosomal protein L11 methyltransferase [Deltaproteobacteria bacterium]
MNPWRVFSIQAPKEQEDALVALLFEYGLTGVEVIDEPGGRVLLKVYSNGNAPSTSPASDIQHILDRVARAFPECGKAGLSQSTLNDENWAENWKAYFRPFKATQRLTIRPSWEEYHEEPGEQVLVLDPGRAFGTGQHDTTALCLQSIEDAALVRDSSASPMSTMLDVGTGTGILAMAGALAGFTQVLAIDIDPDAVAIARKNISVNHLEDRVKVRRGGTDQVQGMFDLVTANLDFKTLQNTAPDLIRCTDPSGRLILSGLLREQGDEIVAFFKPLEVLRRRYGGEWVCLELGRR